MLPSKTVSTLHPRFALVAALLAFLAGTAFTSNELRSGEPGPDRPSAIRDDVRAVLKEQEPAVKRYIEKSERAERMKEDGVLSGGDARVEEEFLTRSSAEAANRILRLVQAHPDDPAALEALGEVIRLARWGGSEDARRALAILLEGHVRNEGVSRLGGKLFALFYIPEAEQLLRAVLKENPSRKERGLACYELAYFLRWQAKKVCEIRKEPEMIRDYPEPWRRALVQELLRKEFGSDHEGGRGAPRPLCRRVSGRAGLRQEDDRGGRAG